MAYDALHFELGIRNLSAMAVSFQRADDSVQDEVRDLVRDFALETRDLARFLCPVDTGFMQAHLNEWFTPSGLGFEVGWDAEDFFDEGLAFYPVFQEFGTIHHAAQPSVGPAWDEIQPEFLSALRTAIRGAIDRLSS